MHTHHLQSQQMASSQSARVVGLLRRAAASWAPRSAGVHSGHASSSHAFSPFTGSNTIRQHGSRALLGKNVFELRAAAATVEQAAAPEPIALPTSDESEQLLRIRHSVSGSLGASVGAREAACRNEPARCQQLQR